MFTWVRVGFGVAVGWILGNSAMKLLSEKTLKAAANNETYVEWLKKNNPEDWEILKKYR